MDVKIKSFQDFSKDDILKIIDTLYHHQEYTTDSCSVGCPYSDLSPAVCWRQLCLDAAIIIKALYYEFIEE